MSSPFQRPQLASQWLCGVSACEVHWHWGHITPKLSVGTKTVEENPSEHGTNPSPGTAKVRGQLPETLPIIPSAQSPCTSVPSSGLWSRWLPVDSILREMMDRCVLADHPAWRVFLQQRCHLRVSSVPREHWLPLAIQLRFLTKL